VQQPLEIWLGGMGPKALERVGRYADGWLGAALGPDAAGAARRRIEEVATQFDRVIDGDHFGLSVPYSHDAPDPATLEALRRRNPDADPADIVPAGTDGLRDLVKRLVDNGLSKFVLRPTGVVTDWDAELEWLADAVLDLQT
jgi:alkanesulfonate monooxygenase SsuD/methylene tetrahydromethanopterin reductase-like flavin-dependent oxidoreductase (luciferase family)